MPGSSHRKKIRSLFTMSSMKSSDELPLSMVENLYVLSLLTVADITPSRTSPGTDKSLTLLNPVSD